MCRRRVFNRAACNTRAQCANVIERDPGNSVTTGSAIDERSPATGRFTRDSRLTEAGAFDRVFQNSRRSADRLFTVLYRPNDLGYPRLGLAIAKKKVRRAVGRNRLKRLIRESFRSAGYRLEGLDIVILARDTAGTANNVEVFASLERHWQALGDRPGL